MSDPEEPPSTVLARSSHDSKAYLRSLCTLIDGLNSLLEVSQ